MGDFDVLDGAAPDFILHNARIMSMRTGSQAATAVAVHGDRIAAVGREELLDTAGNGTKLVNCRGGLLAPGLIDAHIHILASAMSAGEIDCSTASAEAVIATLRESARVMPSGDWLRGYGYQDLDTDSGAGNKRHPTRHELDRAVPDRPLRIRHVSGHASVLNSKALLELKIGVETEEPPGGRIVRDSESGEPTGVLLEMEDWLDRRMPHRSQCELEEGIRRLSGRLLAAGVTSVQDLGHRNDSSRAQFLAKLTERGVFRPRIALATGYDAFAAGDYAEAPGLEPGPVKIMLNETGEQLLPDPKELARRIDRIHRAGRQAAVHAVEPRAVEAALDAIAAAQLDSGRQARHRIEHASITPAGLARRIASQQVIVISNPAFLYEHGDRYLETVPEAQIPHLYDVAGLGRAGICVAAGSDCPVGSPEPLVGVRASMERTTKSARRLPGQTIGLEEALSLYTRAAAYAAFQEREKGQIAPGMRADLVVIDDSDDQLRPIMTVLDGDIAWASNVSPIETSP